MAIVKIFSFVLLDLLKRSEWISLFKMLLQSNNQASYFLSRAVRTAQWSPSTIAFASNPRRRWCRLPRRPSSSRRRTTSSGITAARCCRRRRTIFTRICRITRIIWRDRRSSSSNNISKKPWTMGNRIRRSTNLKIWLRRRYWKKRN